MIPFTKLLFLLLLTCFLSVSSGQNYSYTKNISDKIIPNTLIFKVNKEYRHIYKADAIDNERLESLFSSIQLISIKKKFPNSLPPDKQYNERGNKLVDLSLIYELKYDSDMPVHKIIHFIHSDPAIEYCVPVNIAEPLYDPDDPDIGSQYYLNSVNAFAAWDIHTGDSNVVIGITDSGVDIDHEDLIGNIKYNYDDPVNGIDDDNDGFIDNFRGWDMGDYDNNPQVDTDVHGIWVSGLAAASTDNATGIAGTGFKCRFLPVKVTDQYGLWNMCFESLVYAADHGCDIINCSWRTLEGYSPYEQDIVNYATFNRNALVVAAAGNSGNEDKVYPACYDNVLSVAGTNSSDHLAGGSSYGILVDICAPANNTYTTGNDNTYYTPFFGTSFSSPIVAGCAAIVRSYFPEYSALQVGEQLKVTAYLLDTIPENTSYAGLLGSGRADLYKALTETSLPSVRFENIIITDNDDDLFLENDIVYIKGTYKNYLNSTSNLYAILSSGSPYVSVTGNPDYIGALSMLEEAGNYDDPFELSILSSVPYDKTIRLRLDLEDGEYKAFQFMEFVANSSYLDIDTNNITTTITSKGRIGYNKNPYLNGTGFLYKDGETLLYEAGLLIGIYNDQVSDCIRGDDDFNILSRVQETVPPGISDMEITCGFNDDNSGYVIGIEVIQKTYAWNNEDHKDFIIVEYDIINTNDYSLNGLRAGIFADWDIMEWSQNRISYDEEKRMSYCYYTGSGSYYAGIKLLSSSPVNHFAIDVIPYGGPSGLDITNGFSTLEKWTTLIGNWHTAGEEGAGNDVADVLSSGPYTVAANDTIKILFALLAGENLYNLQNSADAAQELYDSLFTKIPVISDINDRISLDIFPNPANNNSRLTINIPRKSKIDLIITDNNGELIMTVENNRLSAGKYTYNIDISGFSDGIYYINLQTPEKTISEKLIITK